MVKPTIEVREYYLDGVKYTEQMVPPMWVLVDIYTPPSSVTPWDVYGSRHQGERSRALTNAGIEHICLQTRRVIAYPRGTGPKGMVRFGDDMMPSEYRIVVEKHNDAPALRVLCQLQEKINDWLYNNGTMPEELR